MFAELEGAGHGLETGGSLEHGGFGRNIVGVKVIFGYLGHLQCKAMGHNVIILR